MRCQDNVSNVVECKVTIHAIVSELVGHDPTRGIVDQDIQTIGLTADLGGDVCNLLPVREVAAKELDFTS